MPDQAAAHGPIDFVLLEFEQTAVDIEHENLA